MIVYYLIPSEGSFDRHARVGGAVGCQTSRLVQAERSLISQGPLSWKIETRFYIFFFFFFFSVIEGVHLIKPGRLNFVLIC